MATSHLYCSFCGTANDSQDAFCFSCGHPLKTTRPQIQYPAARSTSNTLTGLLSPNRLLKQRYRILEQLGKGGFGAVYKAEDTQFGNRLVGVKEMSRRELKSQQEINDATDAFKREALMLAGLRHQNLPRIYDHFSDSDRWYLVMDYIEGETLAAHLKARGGRLSPQEAIHIAIQLCTVLDYLHTRQPPIIFRDLTPANIMLTTYEHIYLIDFGIARIFKPGQTKDTTAFGTLGYAAPELLSRQTTPQSDIYSLGAILHQMLSGNDPSRSPFRFVPLQLSGHPALSKLSTLVMQMLDMDENRRPASMAAIRQELRQIDAQLAGKAPLSTTRPVRGTMPLETQPVGGAYLSRVQGRGKIFAIIAGIVVVIVILTFLIPALFKSPGQSSSQSALNNSSNTSVSAPTATPFPTLAPTPTPTSIPTPTPTPLPKSVGVLYQADWSNGLSGWVGSSEWKVVNGMLLSDGTNAGYNVAPLGSDAIISPYQPSTPNYAVEAKMQIVDSPDNCYLAVRGRVQSDGSGYDGYFVGFDSYFGDANISYFTPSTGFTSITSNTYSPGLNWHIYRAEFKDNQITLKIDGRTVLQVTDNRFINAGRVGLENGGCQINVSSFKIMAL